MENSSLTFWKRFAIFLVIVNLACLLFILLRPTLRPPHPFPPMEGQRRGDGPAAFIISELKLDTAQQSSFNALKKEHQSAMQKLDRDGKELRDVFFDGLKSDRSLQSQDSILQLILENQKQKEIVTYTHFEQVKHLCNPEQKILYNKIIQEVIERLKPRPHMGPHPHDE